MARLALPRDVRDCLQPIVNRARENPRAAGGYHPGLALDRWVEFDDPDWPRFNQETQKKHLKLVAGLPGLSDALRAARQAREETLRALEARMWTQRSVWRLTLHLSRGAALENAGLCLHPVYGFAYLPGSGLKGMARAYAEMVWAREGSQEPGEEAVGGGLPSGGSGGLEATERMEWVRRVFGCGPSTGRRRKEDGGEGETAGSGGGDTADDGRPDDPGDPAGEDHRAGSVGAVVFHDAWPVGWPRLQVDIVNSHHPQYYDPAKREQAEAAGEGAHSATGEPDAGWEPPGDWQSPVPVYFLTVRPGTAFNFAVSLRETAVPDGRKLLGLAHEWLWKALCEFGAGAKTAAGYGYFESPENRAE